MNPRSYAYMCSTLVCAVRLIVIQPSYTRLSEHTMVTAKLKFKVKILIGYFVDGFEDQII